jgi:hypothetical protein
MRDVTDQSDELEQSSKRAENLGSDLKMDLKMVIKSDLSTARNDGVAEPRKPVLLDPSARCESD